MLVLEIEATKLSPTRIRNKRFSPILRVRFKEVGRHRRGRSGAKTKTEVLLQPRRCCPTFLRRRI